MDDNYDHAGHHDEEDQVVLELQLTRGGQVRSWHSPTLQRETVRQLAEHLTAVEQSMPDPQLHKDDGSQTESGAA